MTSSFLAATSGSCGRFLVLMSISPKPLHGLRAPSLDASEQTCRACHIDIDAEVFFIGYACSPAEELTEAVTICDKVELLVIEVRIHVVDGSEQWNKGGHLSHIKCILVDEYGSSIGRDAMRSGEPDSGRT
jgi:hypothetical protein